MNTKDKIIQKNNNRNIRIFKIYEMFSKDLLFYYAISILFLIQAKNLTISQILLIESSYPLSKVIVQLFAGE